MRQVEIENKLVCLKNILQELDSVLIAYSGGTDSTLLATLSSELLGQKALTVFIYSPVFTTEERTEAELLARKRGFRYRAIEGKQMENPEFVANTPDRCYFCRKDMFRALKEIATEEGLNWIIDGTNHDDLSDFRTGIRAAKESGIRSPLCEAGLTKEEIRQISHEIGLPTWDKPSSPCLASRIPYNTPITRDILYKIGKGEQYLHSLGLHQLRLRHHNHIALIEVENQDIPLIVNDSIHQEIVTTIKALGYKYVALDLAGFRSGNLSEGIIYNESEKS